MANMGWARRSGRAGGVDRTAADEVETSTGAAPPVSGAVGAERLSFEELCAVLAREVAPAFATATPTSRLWHDLGLDELALCLMHIAIEDLNPHFALPDQSDVEFTTLGDVHHYYLTMTEQNVERPDAPAEP